MLLEGRQAVEPNRPKAIPPCRDQAASTRLASAEVQQGIPELVATHRIMSEVTPNGSGQVNAAVAWVMGTAASRPRTAGRSSSCTPGGFTARRCGTQTVGVVLLQTGEHTCGNVLPPALTLETVVDRFRQSDKHQGYNGDMAYQPYRGRRSGRHNRRHNRHQSSCRASTVPAERIHALAASFAKR